MLTIVNDGDALAAVRAFASAIPRGSWFAACGEALTAGEQADAAAYLAALGMPDALTVVTEAAASLSGAASLAMSGAGIADPALTRVAAGAAAQACHQAALALAAAAGPGHVFAVKYRLFAAGRWPLGIVGDRFFVF